MRRRGPHRGTHHIAKRADRLLQDPEARGDPGYLLSTKELARWWGYAVITLEVWRRKGMGPPYIPMPGRICYPLGKAVAWLNEQRDTSTPPERRRGNGAAPSDTPGIGHNGGPPLAGC